MKTTREWCAPRGVSARSCLGALAAGGMALALVVCSGGGLQLGAAEDETGAAAGQAGPDSTVVVEGCLIALADQRVVAAGVEGRLVELAAREGAIVKKGDPLARLDDEQARLGLEMAHLQLDAVKAERYGLQEAELKLARAEQQLARMRAMGEKGLATERERDTAEAEHQAARFRVASIKHQLEVALRMREIEVKAAESALQRHTIDAVCDGTVIETHHRVGEWVRPGDPICRIIRLDRLRVEGTIDVRKCDPAEIEGRDVLIDIRRVWGEFERVPGKLAFVSPLVGEQGTPGHCRFYAEFENPRQNDRWVLRPGLSATVTIQRP
ncbi:MAG: HlyD family efflux transporter periplasmic adaptor subunit [Pirellulales bacterium]|nr:HlyD family efflux transporter periplasmic adaptor subunit [Pirellulales bacterium]